MQNPVTCRLGLRKKSPLTNPSWFLYGPRMKNLQRHLIVASFAMLAIFSCSHLLGQTAGEKFLLLKNGSVVRGTIKTTSAGYEVKSARGSVFKIPANQAAHLLDSMNQVFSIKFDIARKRNRIEPLRQLVYWAVNEKLYASAQQVVNHMKNDPAKKQIAQQLGAYIAESQTQHQKRKQAGNSIRWESKPAVPAGKNQQAQKKTDPSENDSWPSIRELDRLTKGLPEGSMKVFRRLQVRIAKNCYTAGCHSDSNHKFRISRSPPGERIPWRLTQRNIYQVFQFTDKKDPDLSKILHYMSTPHGKQAAAGFPKDSPYYDLMRRWLFHVTDNGQLWRQKEYQRIVNAARNKSKQTQTKVDPNVVPASFTPPTPEALIRGEKKKITSDPFDPDVFNQKYHGRTRAEKMRQEKARQRKK